MSETITIDNLTDTIMKNLKEYTDDVTAGVKNAEDLIAKECVENLKEDSPKKTGKYAKSWKTTVTLENSTEKHIVIHNKEYRLTHLLENGHAKIKGGRTRAFPHIKKNEEKAVADFSKRTEEVIENGH